MIIAFSSSGLLKYVTDYEFWVLIPSLLVVEVYVKVKLSLCLTYLLTYLLTYSLVLCVPTGT